MIEEEIKENLECVGLFKWLLPLLLTMFAFWFIKQCANICQNGEKVVVETVLDTKLRKAREATAKIRQGGDTTTGDVHYTVTQVRELYLNKVKHEEKLQQQAIYFEDKKLSFEQESEMKMLILIDQRKRYLYEATTEVMVHQIRDNHRKNNK